MRNVLTIAELEAETTELLPTRETLTFGFGNNNWAAVYASNSSHGSQRRIHLRRRQQRRRAERSPSRRADASCRGPAAGGHVRGPARRAGTIQERG